MDIFNNIDIVTILKLGPPGLVFLLALFAFYLLLKEQRKKEPKQSILKAINQFMFINIAFAILTISAAYLYEFFDTSEIQSPENGFDIEAQLSSNEFEVGKAAVCSDADYGDKFLLIIDPKTNNMIQVYGTSILPCKDKHTILINRDDAVNLGWPDNENSLSVSVNAAMKGQKFVIDYQ